MPIVSQSQNSYRIRTRLGSDMNLQVKLDQNYEMLEILSFQMFQSDIYTRDCSRFGVVCGRVFANNGLGIPNAKVSIFIPLQEEDENNPIISTLYPYKTLNDFNEDGYKYNLLPYSKSYSNHTPVGTFPDRLDTLIDKTVIELYDKYYKFTVKTNDSGDFMIFGLPLGQQTIVMQVDISDIGQFSLTPQDLVRLGIATEDQVDGTQFKFSTNFETLPQIITISKTINVAPFFGQKEVCDFNIGRIDFDLTKEANIKFEPTAVFMGSLISDTDKNKVRKKKDAQDWGNCKSKTKAGYNCELTTGPGQIEAIRQTMFVDDTGRPVLEEYKLENNGKIIDNNGNWVVELPMNLNYVYNDENGDLVISNDPTIGVPTTAKYRFKVKWEQPSRVNGETKRGYFLVPNIKEYGWDTENMDVDPITYDINPGSINYDESQTIRGILFSSFSDKALRPTTFENVESFKVFLNGVEKPEYQDVIPMFQFTSNNTITVEVVKTDDTLPAKINIEIIPVKRYQVEQSYAFSLNWEDYANPTEAINCGDTFYELVYNKVYTVSQFIDRYATKKFIRNTVGIKNIQDDSCEGNYNKFPTNDVYYRTDFFFVFINFLLTYLKYLSILILVVVHVLALLWPIIALIIIIVQGIIWLVAVICEGINSVANLLNLNINCPDRPDIDLEIFKQNPFRNLGLPLILYNEDGCTRCDCKFIDTNVNDNSVAGQLSIVNVIGSNTSRLSNVNVQEQFNLDINAATIFTGQQGDTAFGTPFLQTGDVVFNSNTPSGPNAWQLYFSSQVSWGEKLNQFSLKDRYYDNQTLAVYGYPYVNGHVNGIQGKGPNQIRVTYAPIENQGTYHYDNTMILLMEESAQAVYAPGTMLTLTNPNNSTDPNIGSLIGVTFSSGTFTVTYANQQNQTENLTRDYTILPGSNEITDYSNNTYRYPTDLEYFQVIDNVSVAEFVQKNPANAQINSFAVVNLNPIYYIKKYGILPHGDGCADNTPNYQNNQDCSCGPNMVTDADWQWNGFQQDGPLTKAQPLTYFQSGSTQRVVILQRGVDPHSPLIKTKIDLSRIYGWANYNQTGLVKELFLRVNVPIRNRDDGENNLKLYDNNLFYTNTNIGRNFTSEGQRLFYSTQMFQITPSDYQTYETDSWKYYSALGSDSYVDNNNASLAPFGLRLDNFKGVSASNAVNNNFSTFFNTISDETPYCSRCRGLYRREQGFEYDYYRRYEPTLPLNLDANESIVTYMGYVNYQYVAGGSYSYINWTQQPIPFFSVFLTQQYDGPCSTDRTLQKKWTPGPYAESGLNVFTYSPSFRSGYNNSGMKMNIPYDIDTNINGKDFKRDPRIVMRSDRLPTSDSDFYVPQPGEYILYDTWPLMHMNPSFALYRFEESVGGNFNVIEDYTPLPQSAVEIDTDVLPETVPQNVIESLSSCASAVPLRCYGVDDNTGIPYLKTGSDCEKMEISGKVKDIFIKGAGCYNLVSRPLLSIGKDYKFAVEWIQRVKVNTAACFNVFSHTFSNNWINGTLYAFPFENITNFTSENKPIRNYCKSLIYFHDAQNTFYYRSSPFAVEQYDNLTTGWFIGQPKNGNTAPGKGNNRQLMFPTTIMDLGPKNGYLQEISYSDDYDGYIIDKLPNTTFNDITDILNIFILSRFVNQKFISLLIPLAEDPNEGSSDPSIQAFFNNRRWDSNPTSFVNVTPDLVDGDYSQMISINSEFGIKPYTSDAYSTVPSVYLGSDNLGGTGFPNFGLYFESQNNLRDLISPRRIVYNVNANFPVQPSDYTVIPVKTQKVPFYQWTSNVENTLKNNTSVIFGNQNNNFWTNKYEDSENTQLGFFSSPYQSLDRLNINSDYFIGNTELGQLYVKGYLINYDSDGNPTAISQPGNDNNQRFTHGTPFFFYFGLINGSTAMDKFRQKYVDPNLIYE
jgi:hypothetical protein